MVRTVRKGLADIPGTDELPFVVELVGPAGAGKTSLVRALTQRNERFVEGTGIKARRIANISFFVGNAVLLLPSLFRLYRDSRWFTWEEIKTLVYLKELHRVLRRQASNGAITILDQGPVYLLTRLHVLRGETVARQSQSRWWDSVLKHWSQTLDMVIWLDAPDAMLLERIRARNKWHAINEKPKVEAAEFLARYRASYSRIICGLRADDGPRVVRFDTAQESLGQIMDKVLAGIDLAHRPG